MRPKCRKQASPASSACPSATLTASPSRCLCASASTTRRPQGWGRGFEIWSSRPTGGLGTLKPKEWSTACVLLATDDLHQHHGRGSALCRSRLHLSRRATLNLSLDLRSSSPRQKHLTSWRYLCLYVLRFSKQRLRSEASLGFIHGQIGRERRCQPIGTLRVIMRYCWLCRHVLTALIEAENNPKPKTLYTQIY